MVVASLVLAVSILSEGIGDFMKLPGWMPVSVDAEHTFGSAAHSNASRRITADTLAAVEAIFEAYHERVFFSSEGLSNDWDVAEYGAQVVSNSDLRAVSFTDGVDRISFRYNPSDRTVPDTRRLVETMTNLPNAYPTMLEDLVEVGTPLLSRGGTWLSDDRDGRIRFACSAFSMSGLPDPFEWSEGRWPSNHSMLGCLVPFNGYRVVYDDFGLPLYGWPVRGRRTDRSIGYSLMEDVLQRSEDLMAAFDVYRDYTYVTNDVTREMADLYGNQTNAVYGTFTRRLAPDEYIASVDREWETNEVEVSVYMADEQLAAFKAWKPWLNRGGLWDGTHIEYVYTYEDQKIRPSQTVRLKVYAGEDYRTEITSFAHVTIDGDPSEFDHFECSMGVWFASYWFTVSNGVSVAGDWGYVEPNQIAGVKITAITNSVTPGISYLAGMSRIIAAHDRTIELPVFKDDGASASNRVDEWTATAHHPAVISDARFKINVNGDGTFDIDPPVDMSKVSYVDTEAIVTNRVSFEAASLEYDTAWYSGTENDCSASASFKLKYPDSELGGPVYAARINVRDISPAPSGTSGVFARIRSEYDYVNDRFTFGFYFDEPWQYEFFATKIVNGVRAGVTSNVTELAGSGEIYAHMECSSRVSAHPEPQSRAWRKMFPAYAPGLLGSSRVRKVQEVFPTSVVFDHPRPNSGECAEVPPFSYGTIVSNYLDHTPTVSYRMDVVEVEDWDPLTTFPFDYAHNRVENVEDYVRERVVPRSLRDELDVGIGNIKLAEMSGDERRKIERGYITGETGRGQDGTPVYISFTEQPDGAWECFDFYVNYDDPGKSYHTQELVLSVLFMFKAEGVCPLEFKATSPSVSATGRTSAAIVTDWDWKALKLDRDDP